MFISDNTTAGDNVLVSLYNGKPGETLNTLHYENFCKKLPIGPLMLNLSITINICCSKVSIFVSLSNSTVDGKNFFPEEWGGKEVEIDLCLL